MSSSLASAPPPQHIIRSHNSPINALFVSGDNERIYSGDLSGLVVITSTRTLRSLTSWKAHTAGFLGVEEWGRHVITHGRDNKLHVWSRPSHPPLNVGGSATVPGSLEPELGYSLDVNALNFCRFSLLPTDDAARHSSHSQTREAEALVALPNLVDSSLADIWTLPSLERIHAAIGKGRLDAPTIPGSDGRGVKNPTGIIMSMHLLPARSNSATTKADRSLSLIASYENGSVKLWRYRDVERERSIEGVGWQCVWSLKLHVESVMATAIAFDRSMALSVSADHLVGRYDLNADLNSNLESAGTVYRTKHPGNNAVSFHDGGRVCAIGGWDGRVRLFSTKSFKPLGTLIYHKGAVQTLAFSHACPSSACHRGQKGGGGSGEDRLDPDVGTADTSQTDHSRSSSGPVSGYDRDRDHDVDVDVEGGNSNSNSNSDDDDEMSEVEKARRSRWLVSGGKDGRVAVWALMDFNGTSAAAATDDGRR